MMGYGIPINADRIRQEATAHGWTLRALADRCGWEHHQLTGILKRKRCRATTLEIIALALELPITELMADDTAQLKVMLDDGYMPTRAHEYDAGLDLYAREDILIKPGEWVTHDTGVHVAIPKGMVGMITSKSGLMSNSGITSRGTIDYGYTGSIKAVLFNHSKENVYIRKGQKITQLVVMPIYTPKPVLVDRFEVTERGNGGFGSTGMF